MKGSYRVACNIWKLCCKLWDLTFWWDPSTLDILGAIFYLNKVYYVTFIMKVNNSRQCKDVNFKRKKKRGNKASLWQLDEWAGAMHHLKCNLRWGSIQSMKEWVPPYHPESSTDVFLSLSHLSLISLSLCLFLFQISEFRNIITTYNRLELLPGHVIIYPCKLAVWVSNIIVNTFIFISKIY